MNKTLKILLLIFFAAVISCSTERKQETNSSDDKYMQTFSEQLDTLNTPKTIDRLYKKIKYFKSDSLANRALLNLSYKALKIKDSARFLQLNRETRARLQKTQDSSALGFAYWDIATLYNQYKKKDSAYYYYNKAQKTYSAIGDVEHATSLLLNMAIVQKSVNDFTGSEISTVEAIKIAKSIASHKELYRAYNNLGIIYNELKEYDRSIFYHQKALNFIKEPSQNLLVPSTLNNIGVVYNNNKEYRKALSNYNKALKTDSLLYKDPELYAMLLDNKAYTNFQKNNHKNLPELFYKALHIRDSHHITSGITISKLHLSEFYKSKKDTAKAINYANEVIKIAENINNHGDVLDALLLLKELDNSNAEYYASKYISLSDSLHQQERTIRNKLARIRLETDEYITEKEQLSKRLVYLYIIATGLVCILILLYIIRHQRAKNKELKLTQEKQYADQEIYKLITTQQKKFEEGREKEKKRISKELHDGILSQLFGIRLNLDTLNKRVDTEAQEKRYSLINYLNKVTIEIRKIAHELYNSSSQQVDFEFLIEQLINDQQHTSVDFQLQLQDTILWKPISNYVKINLYRILQECIQNIHKHANASVATIKITQQNKTLFVLIKDNGQGIRSKTTEGIGLKNINERTKNIKGTLKISSHKEGISGTQIQLNINLDS